MTFAAAAISLMVVAVAACNSNTSAPPPVEPRPVATVAQLMDAIVIPSSQALFDAVV